MRLAGESHAAQPAPAWRRHEAVRAEPQGEGDLARAPLDAIHDGVITYVEAHMAVDGALYRVGVLWHGHDHSHEEVREVVVVTVALVEVGGISQHDAKAQPREGLLDPTCAQVVTRGGRGVGAGHEPTLQGTCIPDALWLVPSLDGPEGGLAPA